MQFIVCKIPTQDHGKINKLYINTSQEPSTNFLSISSHIFAFDNVPTLKPSTIALNTAQREFLNVTIDAPLAVTFVKKVIMPSITLLRMSVEMVNRGPKEVHRTDIIEYFKRQHVGLPFNHKQIFYFITEELTLKVTVTELISTTDKPYGVLLNITNIYIVNESPKLTIIGSEENSILLRNDFSFENLGIGGLKNEFSIMFRRAFVQRLYSAETIKNLGIPHVKGILLYGPPGTGKTLIARRIGSLLNARPPKIVNGPEILNKYVGQSEENIRLLFKDAEEEYKKLKEKSPLHIIIFDELDAIFKSRGNTSNNIGDQVVNQLLSKMDGVEALDNVLIIGMTNRPDLIDKALLRPGRFEIHIEINLPNEESRFEIFNIHTKEMKRNNYLNSNVDLNGMSKMTRNYTGAEICAVVKSAASYALEREVKGRDELQMEQVQEQCIESKLQNKNDSKSETNKNKIDITMNDFMLALEEVKPSFGLKEEDFAGYKKVYYELPSFITAFLTGKSLIEKLKSKTPPKTLSVLFHGEPGTGKTTTAIKTALNSNFPFVKIIAPKHMVGLNDNEKINYIKDRFMEAYKSEESIIILDEIESLIDYVAVGPRFSSSILHCLKIFIKNEEKNKVFVFGTTSEVEMLKVFGIYDCFYEDCLIDLVRKEDFEALCKQNENFQNINFEKPVGIKMLMSKLDETEL
ncbi:transport between ER and Golgi ATPase protein [Conglomerata obtusa]